MDSPLFSVVIPTRHRPEFVEKSLQILQLQTFDDFEVIVCDNYEDHSLSCQPVAEKYSNSNLRYVKPESPLGMVENWNFALASARGQYVIYLTDKMFLLPNTLRLAAEIIGRTNPEILNWIDDGYTPSDYDQPFKEGRYFKNSQHKPGESFVEFDPKEELNKRGLAAVDRKEQSKSDYSRGKIIFGTFHRDLISRIQKKYGQVFFNISPDYTSMISGLYEAKSAVEMNYSGIVHMGTKISNGGLCEVNDDFMLSFLQSLGNCEVTFKTMLVEGLYASQHNVVAHDYMFFKTKFGLDFHLDEENWMTYIYEDLHLPQRNWSSIESKDKQFELLNEYLIRKYGTHGEDYIAVKSRCRKLKKEVRTAEELLVKMKIINRIKNRLKSDMKKYFGFSQRNTNLNTFEVMNMNVDRAIQKFGIYELTD